MSLSGFQRKVKSAEKPLVVDFWAPWCVPCKTTKPILEKLQEEYAGKVDVSFINADKSKDIMQHFKIMGIPTMIAFRDGEVAVRKTGAQTEASYRAIFEALLQEGEVKVPMAPFDRFMRLGSGAFLFLLGLNQGFWWLMVLGGVVAFWGIYDRFPLWAAITGLFKKKEKATK